MNYFRTDCRLVHSTTMSGWVPHLGVQKISLVGPSHLLDKRCQAIVRIACQDLPVSFFSTEEAEKDMLAQGNDAHLVIFPDVQSALKLKERGWSFRRLSLGYVVSDDPIKKPYPSIQLGEKDINTIARLNERGVEVVAEPTPGDTAIPVSNKSSVSRTAKIVNPKGLHLRAAGQLAQLAGSFSCEIWVEYRGNRVNAKSLLGLTTLAAGLGAEIVITADGADSETAVSAICELVGRGLDESGGAGG